MDVKAAFFDIDWTLYDHAADRWVPSGLAAVKSLEKKGIKVFVCSARNYQLLTSFGVFHLGIHWSGYIASAGAIVVVGNHYLQKAIVPQDDVKRICACANRLHKNLELITPKSRFMLHEPDQLTKDYYAHFGGSFPKAHPYRGEEITGSLLFAEESCDEEVRKDLPEFCLFRFAPWGLDIQREPHVKGDGVAAILSHFGWKKENAISFGDGIQDVSMGDSSTFIALGNAKDEVKGKADIVTDRIEEDGVAKALLRLGLIDEIEA